jgi:hypothetical protein
MGGNCCSGAEKQPQMEMKKEIQLNNTWLRLIHGNIAEDVVDVIVNDANVNLNHGGGVAGELVQKGGMEI